MRHLAYKIIFFSVFFPLIFSSHSWAADSEQLKRDVEMLKISVENSNTKLANALNQLTTIQQEFGSIRGVIESGGHFYEEQNRSLQQYDQRMSALEDKIGTLMNLLTEIKEGRVTDKTAASDEAQTRDFQRLLDFINIEDYNKAITGLQSFLQKYPKSSLADNAQYWIGESYYGLNDFKKAISEYQVLIQKYPRSPKVKGALLKQGLSFAGLKMYPEARPFFDKVISEYPNSSEAGRARAKIKDIERLSAASETPPGNPSEEVPQANPSPTQAPSPSPGIQSPTPTTPTPASPRTSPKPPPQNRPASGGLYD
jgi:tol-pal system protein YbgF